MTTENDSEWRTWLKKHERELKGASHYNEYNFAQRVLSYIDDLSPSMVTYQYPLKDSNGKSRYIDFVVDHHTLARPIAIEVDGAKFAGNDYVVRQNAIISQGFHLLRFTNNQVTNEPRTVIKMIESALEGNRRFGESAPVTAKAVHRRNRIVIALLAIACVVTIVLLTRSDPVGVQPSTDGTCPKDHPIKGNVSSSGELIYHIPDGRFYDVTDPDKCFNSEDQARKAGYRKSQR